MENLDKKEGGENCCKDGTCHHGMGCMGGHGCHGCHGGRHHLVKIILKLFIIIIIFSCGYHLGVIVGSIHGEGGYRTERDGYGMMRGYDNYEIVPGVNSATPATTPTSTATPAK